MGVDHKALARIAKDMIAGKKTLDDVWDNAKKTKYLDELEKEGVLPSAKDRLKKPEAAKSQQDQTEVTDVPSKPPKAPHQRDYLLPTNLPTPEQNEFFSAKFCQLFYELQNTLRFRDHEIAIAISFRAFLEILTDTYLRTHQVSVKAKAPLAVKIQAAFADMNSKDKLPEETRAFVSKLNDANEYFSINTLHKVTHNDMHISASDLRSYMNNLDAYLRTALVRVNEKEVAVAAE